MRYTRSPRALARRLALAAVAIGLVACGGDDEMMAPIDLELVGSWSFEISDANTANVTCGITGITLTFTRNGNGYEGSMAGAGNDNIVCVEDNGDMGSAGLNGSSSIRDIVVSGTNVSFEFWELDDPFVATGNFTGNGDTMSGTVTFTLNFGATVVPFTGMWVATRQ